MRSRYDADRNLAIKLGSPQRHVTEQASKLHLILLSASALSPPHYPDDNDDDQRIAWQLAASGENDKKRDLNKKVEDTEQDGTHTGIDGCAPVYKEKQATKTSADWRRSRAASHGLTNYSAITRARAVLLRQTIGCQSEFLAKISANLSASFHRAAKAKKSVLKLRDLKNRSGLSPRSFPGTVFQMLQ